MICTLSASAAAKDARPTLSVLDPQFSDIPAKDAQIVGEVIRDAVVALGLYRVQDRAAMREILAQQEFNKSELCDESCAVQVGRLLQVRHLVTSTLRRSGGATFLSLRLTDVESGEVVRAKTQPCRCEVEGLVATAEWLVRAVVGGAEVGAPPFPVAAAAQGASEVAPVAPVAPEPGRVKVDTQPPGARISIDGAELGKSPLNVSLPPGDHVLQALLEGYEPEVRQQRVVAGKEEQVVLALSRATGTLRLSSSPPGAEMAIDDRPAGHGPYRGEIPVGKHTVSAALRGYRSATSEVTIETSKETELVLTLTPEPVAMRVASEPPGASVSVDGHPVGIAPVDLKVPPGAHVVAAELPAYLPATREVTVAPGELKPLQVSLSLQPAPVKVRVSSDPPGARLTVDGASVGQAPWEGAVQTGVHIFEASLAGYASRAEMTKVLPGKDATVVLSLARARSKLSVTTQPAGAQVLLDDAAAGTTPLEVEATVGVHSVATTLRGYEPASDQVNVEAGKPARRHFALVPERVPVRVLSIPAGASIELDGQSSGPTPFLSTVRPGPHELRVTMPGYRSEGRSAVARPGEPVEMSVQLEAEPVPLLVDSAPDGASVFVDGVAAGRTPLRSTLLPGRHVLRVALDGYETIELPATVAVGQALESKLGLKLALVPLTVETQPPGATVLLDGREVGRTPFRGRGVPSTYALELSLKGYEPARDKLALVPGKEASYRAELKPLPAKVTLESRPAAALLVDDQDAGSTPLTLSLPAGPHLVVARMKGYLDERLELRLEPGEEAHRDLVLQARPARVVLDLQPADARILLDDEDVDDAHTELSLFPGSYHLLAKRRGFLSERRILDLGPGVEERVLFQLKQADTPLWAWVVFGVGLASGVGAGAARLMSTDRYSEYVSTYESEGGGDELYEASRRFNAAAIALAAVSGVSLGFGGFALLWPESFAQGGEP